MDSLNNNISELFDQAMSDKSKSAVTTKKTDTSVQKKVKDYTKDKYNKLKKSKKVKKLIKYQKQLKKRILNKKSYLYNNLKKALIGTIIFILLSLPILNLFLNRFISNNMYSVVKIITIKAILFIILFMLITRITK